MSSVVQMLGTDKEFSWSLHTSYVEKIVNKKEEAIKWKKQQQNIQGSRAIVTEQTWQEHEWYTITE